MPHGIAIEVPRATACRTREFPSESAMYAKSALRTIAKRANIVHREIAETA
jgi:hypothetical protein